MDVMLGSVLPGGTINMSLTGHLRYPAGMQRPSMLVRRLNHSIRVVLSLALVLCGFAFAQYPYVINSFDVTIELMPSAHMNVQERISVTFNEERRGIFRTIPVVYETGKGVARQVQVSSVSVTDEQGRGQTTKITREGRNIKIRVGDKDVWLPAGTSKTYVFRYSVYGVLNWFEETAEWSRNAELYWNVTGDEWDTTIETSSVKVDFPASEAGNSVRAKVFTGPLGSTASDTLLKLVQNQGSDITQTTSTLSASELSVSRSAPLLPGEGLTIVLSVPERLIPRPTFMQSATQFIRANLGFTIPGIMLVLFGLAWARFGRDPRPGPLVVRFEPPDGLSGSECGALIDETVDQRDLSAAFVSLAAKGFLRLIPQEGGIFSRRTVTIELTGKVNDSGLPPLEYRLLELLRTCDSPIDETELRTTIAPHASTLRELLYSGLVNHGFYSSNPNNVRILWSVFGIILAALLGFGFTMLSPVSSAPIPGIVGGVVGAIIAFAFAQGMPRRTARGARARREAQGFEEFIRRARGHELNWADKKQPDQALFEEYLPHAIAFGLVAQWASAFDGIAHTPDWYGGGVGQPFHSRWFVSDLMSMNNSIAYAATTVPRSSGGSGGSSGFGGGGFSGGGFGGGGGGSW